MQFVSILVRILYTAVKRKLLEQLVELVPPRPGAYYERPGFEQVQARRREASKEDLDFDAPKKARRVRPG